MWYGQKVAGIPMLSARSLDDFGQARSDGWDFDLLEMPGMGVWAGEAGEVCGWESAGKKGTCASGVTRYAVVVKGEQKAYSLSVAYMADF